MEGAANQLRTSTVTLSVVSDESEMRPVLFKLSYTPIFKVLSFKNE